MSALGPALLGFYKLIAIESIGPLNFSSAHQVVSQMLASFSFTLLGFFAVVVTVMLVLPNASRVGRYVKNYGKQFFFLCLGVVVYLGIAFFGAMASAVQDNSSNWLAISAICSVNAVVGIFFITMIVARISNQE